MCVGGGRGYSAHRGMRTRVEGRVRVPCTLDSPGHPCCHPCRFRGKLTVFTVLCEQYQPSLRRDPMYNEVRGAWGRATAGGGEGTGSLGDRAGGRSCRPRVCAPLSPCLCLLQYLDRIGQLFFGVPPKQTSSYGGLLGEWGGGRGRRKGAGRAQVRSSPGLRVCSALRSFSQ